MIDLQLGQSCATPPIEAAQFWNPTGVRLDPAYVYRLEVVGEQRWTDWTITCGPDGYRRWYMAWAGRWRRLPTADWFVLAGTIDRHEKIAFVIGGRIERFTPPTAGELTCFANDWRSKYGNNKGSLVLTITRLA